MDENEVVKEWLALEVDKNGPLDLELDADDEYHEDLARLSIHKPDSSHVFRKYDLKWYRHELSEEEFRTLRTIFDGHNHVIEVAQSIHKGHSSLSEETTKRVEMFADQFPTNDHGPLIINRRRWLGTGPFLQDGNHRALGLALHMVRGGDYIPQIAYIGYPTTITGVTRKLRGSFHQLLGRI